VGTPELISWPSKITSCQAILGQALSSEFPLIALFRFSGPLLMSLQKMTGRRHEDLQNAVGQCKEDKGLFRFHVPTIQEKFKCTPKNSTLA
jgi:hypothetical protein